MRATDSSGKCESPPVAMMPTFQSPRATTRAMCWPKAKQRRAVGCGATKQLIQIGTSGGIGRVPCIVLTGARKAWSTGASHDSARSNPAAVPCSRIALASASCSG